MNDTKFILNEVLMNGNSHNLDNSKYFWAVERQSITKYSQLNIQTVYISTEFIK